MNGMLHRGKQLVAGKEWLYGYFTFDARNDTAYILPTEDSELQEEYKVSKYSVGVYTGTNTLSPKQSGEKLFVGDIVEFWYMPDLQYTRGIISAKNGTFVVEWKKITVAGDWINPKEIYGYDKETYLCESVAYAIIGNIYDNPGLPFIDRDYCHPQSARS